MGTHEAERKRERLTNVHTHTQAMTQTRTEADIQTDKETVRMAGWEGEQSSGYALGNTRR